MRKFEDMCFIVFDTKDKKEWDITQKKLLKHYKWISDINNVSYKDYSVKLGLCINPSKHRQNQNRWDIKKIYSIHQDNHSELNININLDDIKDYSFDKLILQAKGILNAENLGLL